MGKSLFPLSQDYEDDKFDDPDKKFKALPYSSEIPELYTDAYKTPPFTFQYFKYQTCRQKSAAVTFYGFLFGWITFGNLAVISVHGNAVTRWRSLWLNMAGGLVGSGTALLGLIVTDLACSPHSVGRRRNMFSEEAVRHALNAKYKIYDNITKIMMSKERITRQQFFEAIIETIEVEQNSE